MFGLGTLINTGAIIVGGIIGLFAGKLFNEEKQESLQKAIGLAVLFISIAGAMQGMLSLEDGQIVSGKSLLVLLSIALGTVIGELIGIEKGFERFGEWLKVKTGNSKDKKFVEGFLSASLTVCVGAMAIVGAIQDGLTGDFMTLLIKGILDFVIVFVMAATLGKGCIFSALPVFVIQGLITVLAKLISPILTETATAYISMVGSVMIFAVGVNLVWGKKFRVGNMVPGVIIAAILAFIPYHF